jgi:hypothetical protein
MTLGLLDASGLILDGLSGGFVLRCRRFRQVRGRLTQATVAILPFCGIVFIYQGMAERYGYRAPREWPKRMPARFKLRRLEILSFIARP